MRFDLNTSYGDRRLRIMIADRFKSKFRIVVLISKINNNMTKNFMKFNSKKSNGGRRKNKVNPFFVFC